MAISIETTEVERRGVSRVLGAAKLPTYLVPDDGLAHGASLGNSSCWVTTKATGALESVSSLNLGRIVFGTSQITYSGGDLRILGPQGALFQPQRRAPGAQAGQASLEREGRGQFEIHPVYQRHTFTLPGGIEVEETLFLPLVGPASQAPTACRGLRLHNRSNEVRSLHLYAFAAPSDEAGANIDISYDVGLSALVAADKEHPEWVRLIAFDRPPTTYEALEDRSLLYEPYERRTLSGSVQASGDVVPCLQLDLEIQPNESESLGWTLCFSEQGLDRARESLLQARDWEKLLQESIDRCSDVLRISDVMVPDRAIADGILWAKVNMLRVLGNFPVGPGFTNEPKRSSNVVVRDLAWYTIGCDYFLPHLSQEMLREVARFQQESGMIPEYWDARNGRTEDYGMNINDDTPLFIVAVGFHSLARHDRGFMRDIYPAAAKAARYLISQMDDRGLIICTSRARNTWGIASWRNVIPDITLSGAVTEINAMSYGALVVVAQMAQALGNSDDFDYFSDAASSLRDAINTHLLNPSNGLYYLNIDLDGKPDPDVTSDEMFPVMFGVAPPDVAFRIVSRLVRPDFITRAGLRTASRNSPEYTPDREVGLRGGVWPGVAFWFARAAAPYYPEATIRALSCFQHYNEDPLHNNTVPGQFSEWFDGESLANRGMRLSPWEAPRMLWAAITGMLGLQHKLEGCTLQPRVPDRWKWLGIRRMPHGDGEETLFLARQDGQFHLFHGPLHGGLATDLPHTGYERDVTQSLESLHPDAHVVALAKADELLICIGSSAVETVTMPIEIHDLMQDNTQYRIDLYDSELNDWISGAARPGKDLKRIASSVEPGGFRLFRVTRVRP